MSSRRIIKILCQRPGCGGRAFRGLVERDDFHCAWCGHRVDRRDVVRQVRAQIQRPEGRRAAMTITGELIAIIVGIVTIGGILVGWAIKSGRRSAKLEDVEKDLGELKSNHKDELAQLKLEYAEDLRNTEERMNRRIDSSDEQARRDREKLDGYVSSGVQVHTALATIAAGQEAFNKRFDSFESSVGKQIDALFALFNNRGPTGPA